MTEAIKNSRRSFVERFVNGPIGFRQSLERLGPTFIKIGQFLALRPDLVPQEYCDELMLLMDQVTPFSWEQAKAILKAELRGEPNEIFAYINPRPVAAGSLAQTHIARLKDGIEVAVKIQRPNILAKIERDLKRAKRLARLLEMSGSSFIISPRKLVEELARWLMQEVDFHHEMRNLTRLYELAAGSRFQKIPQPFPAYSTARVLTTEYLRGLPISELLLALHTDGSNREEQIDAFGIDRDQLATNLLWSSLVQIFRYQFFHADLHPGNLIALPGNIIGFVDFGLCDELDETIREGQMRYLSAFYSRDGNRMFGAISDILIPSEETDMEAFRAEFMTAIGPYLNRARKELSKNDSIDNERDRSPTAQSLAGILRAARQHKLHVPAKVLSMYRALLTAETVAYKLGTEADLRSVGREFFSDLQLEELLRGVNTEALESTVLSMVPLLRDSPGQINKLLSELSEGRFEIKVSISEAPKLKRIRNQRLQLLVTSILSIGIALLLAIPTLPTLLGISLRWLLWTALILLYAWIFLQWRRLR
ncbi:MAG: AarF/UbiB family protein [Acidobacteriota bacterium]